MHILLNENVQHHRKYMGGLPKQEFIYEKLCIYSYMFKILSPSKYSPFDAIQLMRCFSHCSKQFLNSLILMPFSVSAVFCFSFPFEDFLQSEKQTNKKLLRVRPGK